MSNGNQVDARIGELRLPDNMLALLTAIPGQDLRQQVEMTARHCLAALNDLNRIHLPQDQFEERGSMREADDRYLEIAPYVLAAVASINRLLAYLVDVYPAPAAGAEEMSEDDFDFEFDLVDEAPSGGNGSGAKADDAQEKTPDILAAEAAHAYGGMLRSRVLSFGERLSLALRKQDSWPLLAEVDDYQHRLIKSVQGLLFGVMSVFAPGLKRDELLPEYRSAVDGAVALRTALTDLSFHIGRFNDALSGVDGDSALPLVVGVADRLSRFASQPEYRSLRAEDKKAVIDFRRLLYDLRHDREGIKMVHLRHAVEGFSKFLESMQAINHREVLVLHDRKVVEDALARLHGLMQLPPDQGRVEFTKMADAAVAVYGRNPELDQAIREYRDSHKSGRSLPADIQSWLVHLQTTLGMIG